MLEHELGCNRAPPCADIWFSGATAIKDGKVDRVVNYQHVHHCLPAPFSGERPAELDSFMHMQTALQHIFNLLLYFFILYHLAHLPRPESKDPLLWSIVGFSAISSEALCHGSR